MSKTVSQKFAEFMKTKRTVLGISQGNLAYKLYGNKRLRAYLCNIEKGKRTIQVRTMFSILELLNSQACFILPGGKEVICKSNAEVADFITKQRKRVGMKKDYFAERIGISKTTLNFYEKNTHEISLTLLQYILELVNVDIGFMEK